MLAGQKVAQLLKVFETDIVEESENELYHEEGHIFDKNFKQQRDALISNLKSLGNPFLGAGYQLFNKDSRDVLQHVVLKNGS